MPYGCFILVSGEIIFEEVPRLLTVSIHERIKRLSVGDTVTIYLSEKTPVYSRDGAYLIYGYYAVEIRKGA